MEFNRAAIGALAVVGVVAASAGAYIAGRNNPANTQPLALQEGAPNAAAALGRQEPVAPVPGSVTETENSILPAPVAVEAPAAHHVASGRTAAAAPSNTVRRQSAPRARTTEPAAEPSRPTYSPPASSAPTAPIDRPVAAAVETPEATAVERVPAVPEPPQKAYEELVVPADSVIGLQIEDGISSDRAKVEDAVRARITRDVRVRDQVAIPAGARAEGAVTLVDAGGRLKDQARLGIRFHTIVLADGTRLPINSETIYRDGESPARESAAKIGGGAVGGAVIGAILGGKRGAIIGSTVGAGAGGVAVASSQPNVATLPAGSTVTVRISSPATVTVER